MSYKSDAIKFLVKNYKRIFKELLQRSLDFTHEQICSKIAYENSIDINAITEIKELQEIYNLYFNQEFLRDLVSSTNLQEVIIHGIKKVEFISIRGDKSVQNMNLNLEDLEICLSVLSLKNQQFWNFKNPFVSFLLELDGQRFRCTLTHSSINSFNYPVVFLRKISNFVFDLENYSTQTSLVKNLIKEKKNIIIAGSTGSGKTSFLKSCLSELNNTEHVIVIEDTNEIIFEEKNFTNLLSSNEGNKTMTDFCKYAMRMSPERIILGEIRSNEIVPFTLAMNTGHNGLMATIHANSAIDTLSRLSMLFSIFSNASGAISYEQIMQLICKNVDYVIFLENKKIKEIIEVKGAEGINPIINEMTHQQLELVNLKDSFFYAS